jgi:predicted nucleotidyltransferase
MDLKELHSFKLADAVTFHDKLNPKLFVGTRLRPQVERQLKIIAQDFLSEMGVKDLDVTDITISGSNAAYSYTAHSDLDLHILVDMNQLKNDEVYREFFDLKKTLYNDSHDITINGIPVELYIQDSNQPVVSLGEYSVLHNKWIRLPTKRRANFDQTGTKAKYDKLARLIELALQSKDLSKLTNVLKTIKRYRQAGLDKGGEFGPENIAYKALRSQGYITKLYALRDTLHSKHLSIESMYQDPVKMKDSLADTLSKEFKQYQTTDEDYDPNGVPPGPEFKPTMPAGTVRVDVSDVYDWYKLGQNISNLDRVDPKIFGKGPPSTIMAFGSEPEEHEYITNLKKLGLTTTDIDPVDPKQPKNIPRQKVDPTYNVSEAFDQPYPIKWEKSEYGDYDALATLPDGTQLSIMFNQQEGDEGEEATQVEFYRNNSQEVTGEGDAQKVFATVLTAIQQYVKKHKPVKLTFSASKLLDPSTYYDPDEPTPNPESRAKLYDRLVQRYAKAWGYRALRADTHALVIYELSRIKSRVAEGKQPGKSVVDAILKVLPMAQEIWFHGSRATGKHRSNSDTDILVVVPDDLVGERYLAVVRILQKLSSYLDNYDIQPTKLKTNIHRIAQEEGRLLWSNKQDVAEASGYIPSEKQKKDPRFKTALTVDVKPDSIKKNAKAFSWLTNRAGIPPTANPNGKT